MKTWIRSAIVVLASIAGSVVMVAALRSGPDAPPGADGRTWVALCEDMGILLHEDANISAALGESGTLMVRRGGQWRPLYLDLAPPGVIPARH